MLENYYKLEELKVNELHYPSCGPYRRIFYTDYKETRDENQNMNSHFLCVDFNLFKNMTYYESYFGSVEAEEGGSLFRLLDGYYRFAKKDREDEIGLLKAFLGRQIERAADDMVYYTENISRVFLGERYAKVIKKEKAREFTYKIYFSVDIVGSYNIEYIEEKYKSILEYIKEKGILECVLLK